MGGALVEVPGGVLARVSIGIWGSVTIPHIPNLGATLLSYIFFPSPTPVFPALPSQSWSVHKKPILASSVVVGATGKEVQLARAAYPRWAFTLSYGWLREQTQNTVPDATLLGFRELEQITGLFLLCKGSYGEFYFDDPEDDSRSANFVGWGDGVTTAFQVYYTWGNGPFSPPMQIPVGGIKSMDAVYFGGVAQSPGTYSLDSTNTMLVFATPPPAVTQITADFHFYFRCRFLDDHLNFGQFAKNKWELKEIRFESVKP